MVPNAQRCLDITWTSKVSQSEKLFSLRSRLKISLKKFGKPNGIHKNDIAALEKMIILLKEIYH